MSAEFVKRRDYMVDRINSMNGVSCIKPNGAFYVMMNISKLIGKEIAGMKITVPTALRKLCWKKQMLLWFRVQVLERIFT